ncbi:hypothetical protein ACOSQ4_013687 [Xanthoceras sorbifolium]
MSSVIFVFSFVVLLCFSSVSAGIGCDDEDSPSVLMLPLLLPLPLPPSRISATATLAPPPHYNLLVQTWPPGYCLTYNCGRFRNSSFPHSLFDMYLRYEMDTYWQSLNIPNNLRFWFHEWNTHGRCQTTLTALNYFKRTVQLALTTDLLSTLKAYGIIPDGSLYRRSDFEDAIYDITRKIPQFSCDRNGVLTEEIICVDKHAENFIPCQNYQGKCNADPIGLVN